MRKSFDIILNRGCKCGKVYAPKASRLNKSGRVKLYAQVNACACMKESVDG